MNFGYLIVISYSPNVDYLKLAYAAALSIKNTQKEGYDKVALVTDDVEAVKKLFGREPNRSINPDEAVAYGAAV